MISPEIISFFDTYPNLKKYFLGTFSIDTVPKTIPINHFLICNTDTRAGPGIHWFAIFRFSKQELECFDSLGISEEKRELLTSLNFKGVSNLVVNVTQVQPNESISCGEFALYFLYERLHNLDFSFHELVNELFVDNLTANEEEVKSFFSR